MHPFLAETLAALDVSRAALRGAVAAVPEPLRRQRPSADRWSVIEIVEHLSLVETRFCAMVGAQVDDAILGGLGPETGSREPLPSPTAGMLADRAMRRSAPDPAQPTGTLSEADAWAAAEAARAAFRAAVTRGDGLALSTVVYAHPFFGALTVYQWVELIAAHETRHVAQVREVAAQFAGQDA